MASLTSRSAHGTPNLARSSCLLNAESEILFDGNWGSDDEELSRSSENLNREVYMSLVWHGGHVGIAHYDLSSLQIHVTADTLENDNFSLIKQIVSEEKIILHHSTVVREVQPTAMVLSALQDNQLIAYLKKMVNDRSPGSMLYTDTCKLEFLPNSDFSKQQRLKWVDQEWRFCYISDYYAVEKAYLLFSESLLSYEVSKRRILTLNLPSVPRHFTVEERKLYFSSLISLDSTNMIRSVGGLLKYLEKLRVGIELEDTRTCVPVLGFRKYSIESMIQMDTITYCALNIFHMELHPSAYKFGSSGSKEGLSLFGILNRCRSSIGSKVLRQWFTRPLKNASVLCQRYDAISFFMTPCNVEIVTCLQGCLKHIKYIPKILLRMSKAQATIGDWLALSKTIYHAVYIGEICRAQNQMVEIFRKIGAAFTDDLHRCANIICKTIDFEASKQNKRFVVKANVDDELDAKKRTFNGLPDLMSQVAREELEGLSDDIPGCVVSYLPQVGYLLVIDMPEGKTESDDHTIEGLQYKFASNNQLFYKSPKTLELDRILGDTQLDIIDMEVNIMHRLQSAILENTQVLLDVMELAAELDCLMALATCASEFGYTRPHLVEEDVLSIKAGRHPLQELCCSPFVPNNSAMGGRYSKIVLLTGPNACGKSVYLKQVALIVFMAHIGSFVPAEEARIGAVDQIFSRIKSLESVSGGLSTFMQDSIQISTALRLATSHSLVVVDEFGKGTETTDGLALLTAALKFWMARGSACPLVLVSTHFHSIIQQKLLPQSMQLQFLKRDQMEGTAVLLAGGICFQNTLDTVMNGEELVFLYQIREGHTSSSYAGNIAVQVGMSSAIIKRSSEVSDLLRQNKSVPHLKDTNTKQQNERHERIVDAFLKLDLDRSDLHSFLKDTVLQMCCESSERSKSMQNAEQPQRVPELRAVHGKESASSNKVTKAKKALDKDQLRTGLAGTNVETASTNTQGEEVADGMFHPTTSDKSGNDMIKHSLPKSRICDKSGLRNSFGGAPHVTNIHWERHLNSVKEHFDRTPLHQHRENVSQGQNVSVTGSCIEKLHLPRNVADTLEKSILIRTRETGEVDITGVERRKTDLGPLFPRTLEQSKQSLLSERQAGKTHRPDRCTEGATSSQERDRNSTPQHTGLFYGRHKRTRQTDSITVMPNSETSSDGKPETVINLNQVMPDTSANGYRAKGQTKRSNFSSNETVSECEESRKPTTEKAKAETVKGIWTGHTNTSSLPESDTSSSKRRKTSATTESSSG